MSFNHAQQQWCKQWSRLVKGQTRPKIRLCCANVKGQIRPKICACTLSEKMVHTKVICSRSLGQGQSSNGAENMNMQNYPMNDHGHQFEKAATCIYIFREMVRTRIMTWLLLSRSLGQGQRRQKICPCTTTPLDDHRHQIWEAHCVQFQRNGPDKYCGTEWWKAEWLMKQTLYASGYAYGMWRHKNKSITHPV